MSDIHTGGGASIGRDANAGRDVIGRDVNAGPSVHNYLNRDEPHRSESDRAILERIDRALRGDPYNPKDKGLLYNFEVAMTLHQTAKEEREALSSKVTFLSNASLIQSIVLFVVVVVLVGILVYLGLQWQSISQPPAAAVQYPHSATVEGESAVDEDSNLPVGDNGDTGTDYRYSIGGKEWAIGVAGLAGMFGEPFSVFVPNPEVKQIAQGQAQRNDIEQAFGVDFHRESIQQ